jgi:hypothetical protein
VLDARVPAGEHPAHDAETCPGCVKVQERERWERGRALVGDLEGGQEGDGDDGMTEWGEEEGGEEEGAEMWAGEGRLRTLRARAHALVGRGGGARVSRILHLTFIRFRAFFVVAGRITVIAATSLVI